MPHYDSDGLGSGVFFDEDEAPTAEQFEAAFGPPTFSGTLAELERREADDWVGDLADALGEHQIVTAYLTNAVACRAVDPFNAAVGAFHLSHRRVVEALGRTPQFLQT